MLNRDSTLFSPFTYFVNTLFKKYCRLPVGDGIYSAVLETLAVQKILNEEMARAKAVNPSFSLRSLARRLKVSPATLSLLINGRRSASKKFAKSLSRALSLDPKQEEDLLSLYELKQSRAFNHAEELRLKTDQFNLISDWHGFAILSLLETKNAEADPKWLARRLGISQTTASQSLERLGRLGLVILKKNGCFKLTGQQIQTSDEIASTAIQKSHQQTLDHARASLANDPLELRDFLSVTMAIDPAKIPQAKLLLREFRQKMCSFLESGEKSEVYALALQLIPLSKFGDQK